MMNIDRPAKVIAASAGIGTFIGLSPYIGLHTYMTFFISGAWNLPVAPMLVGAYITNPLTIPIVYGLSTKLGMIILNQGDHMHFDWDNVTISSLLEAGKHLIWPFIVGTHVAAIVLSLLMYVIVFGIVKIYRD